MNKYYKTYLAGKMSGLTFEEMNTWRIGCKCMLSMAALNKEYNICIINPVDFYNFKKVEYQSEDEVMDYDLMHVNDSDFLIVNLDQINTSTGTQIEVYDAWKSNKPIFAFGECENLHPWINRCLTRKEKDYKDIIDYLENFYFI